MQLLQAMMGSVLPVFILAALGWVARRVLKADVKDPARVAVYILVPGLVANSILNAQMVAGELGKIVSFSLLMLGLMIALTLVLGRLLGWKPVERSAAVLSTAFMNSANYGLPVVLFAFGQAGFDRAAVYVVVQTLLMYTVAVFFAARGNLQWRDALLAVFRLPLLWAAAGAMAVRLLGFPLPEPLTKTIGLLANGALSLLVIILGMQVAGIQLRSFTLRVGVPVLLRLVVSPLAAMGLVAWLQPEPLTAKVLVLESAMPAAVNTTLLAVQFDTDAEAVSAVTLITTLLSLVTVAFWVWYLQ
ncbi:MAG TPA: AEC family transporter [Symbiobacteriaceae bacterium]|nr:AEC family transporter [Symbiobacteriaceae bacterium]